MLKKESKFVTDPDEWTDEMLSEFKQATRSWQPRTSSWSGSPPESCWILHEVFTHELEDKMGYPVPLMLSMSSAKFEEEFNFEFRSMPRYITDELTSTSGEALTAP